MGNLSRFSNIKKAPAENSSKANFICVVFCVDFFSILKQKIFNVELMPRFGYPHQIS